GDAEVHGFSVLQRGPGQRICIYRRLLGPGSGWVKTRTAARMTRFPPGPKSSYPGSGFLRFRKDPMGFLERMAREFGDIVHWKMGGQNVFLINDANLIRDVLITQDKKFDKQLEAARLLLGLG